VFSPLDTSGAPRATPPPTKATVAAVMLTLDAHGVWSLCRKLGSYLNLNRSLQRERNDLPDTTESTPRTHHGPGVDSSCSGLDQQPVGSISGLPIPSSRLSIRPLSIRRSASENMAVARTPLCSVSVIST